MEQLENIEPFAGERPSAFAVRLSEFYLSEEPAADQTRFVPLELAMKLAASNSRKGRVLSLLEPACGTAILSCAQLEYWAEEDEKPINIQLTVYEKDFLLLALAEKALRYLKNWLKARNIHFDYKLTAGDFILRNERVLRGSLFTEGAPAFDMILCFPPQQRISSLDNWGQAAQPVEFSLPDLYTVYLTVAQKMLKNQGGVAFILPRKMMFSSLLKDFRMHIFRQLMPKHLLVNGPATVLPDHFVLLAEQRSKQGEVQLLQVTNLETGEKQSYSFWELFQLRAQHKIFALPFTAAELEIFKQVKSWNHRLQDLGLSIAGGKIEKAHLKKAKAGAGHVSYLPFSEVKEWEAIWNPVNDLQVYENLPARYVVPNQSYMLLRAKANKKGTFLNASWYKPETCPTDWLALDKKSMLMVLPAKNWSVDATWGLLAFLNSEWITSYIGILKGFKTLSAAEWKELPFPAKQQLEEIGKRCRKMEHPDRQKMSEKVRECLNKPAVFV